MPPRGRSTALRTSPACSRLNSDDYTIQERRHCPRHVAHGRFGVYLVQGGLKQVYGNRPKLQVGCDIPLAHAWPSVSTRMQLNVCAGCRLLFRPGLVIRLAKLFVFQKDGYLRSQQVFEDKICPVRRNSVALCRAMKPLVNTWNFLDAS